MASNDDRSARLIQAYQLLRSVVDQSDELPEAQQPAWYPPPLPPLDPGGRISATDILSWWFRPPSRSGNPWDSYFGESFHSTTRPLGSPEPPARAVPPPAPFTRSSHIPSWTAIRAFLPDTDVALADDDADAAVNCLYDFLHAVGRRDIDAAMAVIADDYHTFEEDREVNREALRNRIEGLLETLKDCEIDISLSMAPEPVFHPSGILIYAEIQIDAFDAAKGSRRTILDRRVAVFEQRADGTYAISALSAAHP